MSCGVEGRAKMKLLSFLSDTAEQFYMMNDFRTFYKKCEFIQ